MSSSLKYRILLSAGIIVSLFFLVALDLHFGEPSQSGIHGVILIPIGLIAGLLAAREVAKLQPNSDRTTKVTSVVATAIVFGLSCVPSFWSDYPADCPVGKMGWPVFGLALAVGIAFVVEMLRYSESSERTLIIQRVSIVVFASAYIGMLLGFGVRLRDFENNALGMTALLSLLIPVKLSDIFAFCGGKLTGRTKLWPVLSPGKTVEGTAFGLFGGVAGALIVFYVIAPWLTGHEINVSVIAVIAFGLCVTVAGIVGDLAESLLKRGSGKKDSSSWLPGLGGVLDIFDSLLAAAPVAWAFWISGFVTTTSS